MTTMTSSDTSALQDIRSGKVSSFNERTGYGYIIPDEPIANSTSLIVHRRSLRHPTTALVLAPGIRVLFTSRRVPSGLLATDVRLEADDLESAQDSYEATLGTMEYINTERGYGFIQTFDGRNAFCHVTYMTDSLELYDVGTPVQCDLVENEKGWIAINVTRADETETQQHISPSSAEDILKEAGYARDSKDYDLARKYYDQGLSEAPSIKLILSYAAFEKNSNRRKAAMEIYKKGIDIFPTIAKLREDAGVLAYKMGDTDTAIELLSSALEICRKTRQQGEVAVLTALARAYAQKNEKSSLRKALDYYEKAMKIFGHRRRMPFRSDKLAMDLLRIRLQHYRGELTYKFLTGCGFKIHSVPILTDIGTGADLFVQIESEEIEESYGISGNILVRCMFKTTLEMADLTSLDQTIARYLETEILDAQIVLLVLSSVPDSLRTTLFQRIDSNERSPVIVPLPQEIIETSDSPLAALRRVLDTWLYRRDLFAEKFPVVGRLFFGRNRILAELREAIASARPSGIFGLRKVGKTSLLKECARRSSAIGDIVIYIDLLKVPSDINDTRWLYWRMANLLFEEVNKIRSTSMHWRLGGKYLDILDVPPDFLIATAFNADMEMLIQSIQQEKFQPQPKIVILLDEIERILPTVLGKGGFEGFFDFFGYLRGVAQESGNLVVIVTGANPSVVEASQFEGRDNPVFNFFQGIYLQLLEENEAKLMMRRLGRGMGIDFDDSPDSCEYIFELLGGHPYLTREFCSLLAKKHTERPLKITKSDVKGYIEEYLALETNGFQEIVDRLNRDYQEELDICVTLAQKGVPASLKELLGKESDHGHRIKHLVGYQLVKVENGKVFLTMKLFQMWILRWLG